MTFGEHLRNFMLENPYDHEEKTWYEYNRIAEKHIIPKIGHVPLFKITPQHIETYKSIKKVETRLDGKNTLSSGTINQHLAVIADSLENAFKKGYIGFNPARAVKRVEKLKREGPRNHARTNCLSMKDQSIFISKLEELYSLRGIKHREIDQHIINTLNNLGFTEKEISSPKVLTKFETIMLYPIIYLAFNTGMRLSELLALEWTDINFEKKKLHINKSSHYGIKKEGKQSGHYLSSVKTDKERIIDLADEDISFLKKHKAEQNRQRLTFKGKYYDNNLVFAKSDGTYLRNDSVSKAFTNFANRLGYKVTFHSTRHFHITSLLMMGVPPHMFQHAWGMKENQLPQISILM